MGKYKVGGLFSGVGGIELGFKKTILKLRGQMKLIKTLVLPIEKISHILFMKKTLEILKAKI